MPKIVSCGIVPIRLNGNNIEILLCRPTNAGFYGMGFLKGQIEKDETILEAAKREFSEESGGLDVELFNEETFFVQNNPKKKIFIWPAKVPMTQLNEIKIKDNGEVPDHDAENDLIKFYPINKLPVIFRNQQKILDDLLDFINQNKKDIF